MPFTHKASSSATLCTSRRISLVSKDTGGLYIGISYSTDVCSRHSSRAAFSLDATEAGASDSNTPQFTRWGSLPVSTSRHTVCNKKMFPCRLVMLVGQLRCRHCDWEHPSGIQDNLLWKPTINAYCKTCCDREYLGGIQDDVLWEPIIITYCLLQQNLLWLGASPLHTRLLAVKTNHKFYIQQNLLWLGDHHYIQDNLLWEPIINSTYNKTCCDWKHHCCIQDNLLLKPIVNFTCSKTCCEWEHHHGIQDNLLWEPIIIIYSKTCHDWEHQTQV